MENYRKAPKLYFDTQVNLNDYSIKGFIRHKINSNLSGKHGNQIKLINTLLDTKGDGTFGVSEAWITTECEFDHSAYIRARKALIKLGWIDFSKGKIIVRISKLLEGYSFPDKKLSKYDKNTQNYINSFLKPTSKYYTVNEEEITNNKNVNYKDIKEYIQTMDYSSFLQTTYWKVISRKKKKDSKNKCQVCNSKDKLNVHHSTYEHHGEEHKYIDTDLICLCEKCHSLFHNKDKE